MSVITEEAVFTTEWINDAEEHANEKPTIQVELPKPVAYNPNVDIDRMKAELKWMEEQDKLPRGQREWNQSMYFATKAQRVDCCDDCREQVEKAGVEHQMCVVGHIAFTDLGEDNIVMKSAMDMLSHARSALGVSEMTVRAIASSSTASQVRFHMEEAAGGRL